MMIRRDDSAVASVNYGVALSSSWSKPLIKSRNGHDKNRRAPKITASFQMLEIHKMLKTFVSGIVMM